MKLAIFSASLVLLLAGETFADCPPGYAQPFGTDWSYCYKVYSDLKSRTDAASQCSADKGRLASVPNAFVNSYIYTLATEAGTGAVTLGIQCGTINSTCTNDDRTKFLYSNWATAEPTTGEHCVSMSTKGRDSQQWHVDGCISELSFACEYNVNGGNGTTCPGNYTEFQGTCYSIINDASEGLNRKEMSAKCRKHKGGQLATIANSQVNDFLMNLEKTSTNVPDPSVIVGLRCSNVTVAGDTSSCVWDDGTPFSYNGFDAGQPSASVDPDDGCVSFEIGKWAKNIHCTNYMYYYYYICQAPLQ